VNDEPREPGRSRGRRDSGEERTRARGLFEQFPHGLLLVGEGRRIVGLNEKARALLAPEGSQGERSAWTCCDLVCEAIERQRPGVVGCVTRRVQETGEPLSEVQIEVKGPTGPTPVSVTAAPLDAEDVRVLFQLRPRGPREGRASIARSGGRAEARKLHIHALGGVRIELGGKRLEGEWTEQRPGRLLSYLVCHRQRVASSEQIAEALWPDAPPREALTSLRHYVHVLRDKLEPRRRKRATSSFIKTHRGGYRLDAERVWIDAQELEQRSLEGLRLFVEGQLEAAGDVLDSAVSLHGGELFPDEPEAEWLLVERERLHDVVARILAALIDVRLAGGDLEAAGERSRLLADLEPLDTHVQRQHIEIRLRQGRRSDAMRRYELLRTRTLRELGHEPDFTMSDLAP
jgi:SARP family transcriptional regulator, regulator of embCAB operon